MFISISLYIQHKWEYLRPKRLKWWSLCSTFTQEKGNHTRAVEGIGYKSVTRAGGGKGMAILLPRHWCLQTAITVPGPGRAKRKAVVPSHPDCVCYWVCGCNTATLGIASTCTEQEAWSQVFEIARAWETSDPMLTAQAYRHPHHTLFALLKPEQMDGLLPRSRIQEKIECARNVWGEHFWNTKGREQPCVGASLQTERKLWHLGEKKK